jgi:hypothetical protein
MLVVQTKAFVLYVRVNEIMANIDEHDNIDNAAMQGLRMTDVVRSSIDILYDAKTTNLGGNSGSRCRKSHR